MHKKLPRLTLGFHLARAAFYVIFFGGTVLPFPQHGPGRLHLDAGHALPVPRKPGCPLIPLERG